MYRYLLVASFLGSSSHLFSHIVFYYVRKNPGNEDNLLVHPMAYDSPGSVAISE